MKKKQKKNKLGRKYVKTLWKGSFN